MSAESAREAALEGTEERIEQEVTEETEVEGTGNVDAEEQKETKETKEEQGVQDVEAGPVDPTTLSPALSQGEREGAVRAEHPAGEVFFRGGSAEEVTENEAEEIARRQLARSGLLRGQKVRVAD